MLLKGIKALLYNDGYTIRGVQKVIKENGTKKLLQVENENKLFNPNLVCKYGKTPVVMHTNSSYPTPRAELNLNLIPFYKERYNCVIGYSGHEPDLEPTVVAVALGAKVIERHITLSHDVWGTDQKSSLEVVGMDKLRKRCIDVGDMLGSDIKTVTESELPIRKKLRG